MESEIVKKDTEVISLKKIILYYIRHWKWFGITFLVSLILSVLYLVIVPKTYQINANVLISDDSSPMTGMAEAAIAKSFGIGGLLGSSNVDDELLVIASQTVMTDVVRDLKLYITYQKPYTIGRMLYNSSPIILAVNDTLVDSLVNEIEFVASVESASLIKIKMESKDLDVDKEYSFSKLPAVLSVNGKDFTFSYRNNMYEGPVKMNITINPISWIAEELKDDLVKVDVVEKNSSVVELITKDNERERGKDILASVIKSYNDFSSNMDQKNSERIVEFLNERLNVVQKELSGYEDQVQSYKNKNNFFDLEAETKIIVEQLSLYQQQMAEAESRYTILDLLVKFFNEKRNLYEMVPLNMAIDEKMSEVIMLYNEKLVARNNALKNMKDGNPALKTIEDQVQSYRNNLIQTITDAQKSIKLTKAEIDRRSNAITSKINSLPDYERDFVTIKRNQEIQQAIFIYLLQKREETAMGGQQNKIKAKIINEPYVLKDKVAPKKLFALIFILFFTLLIPIILLFIREQFTILRKEV